MVADQDENSKVDDKTWHSWLKTGILTLHKDMRQVSIKWDPEMMELISHVSEKGRGVELSELVAFNGKLYTVDDRSGIGTRDWRGSDEVVKGSRSMIKQILKCRVLKINLQHLNKANKELIRAPSLPLQNELNFNQ